MRAEITTRLGKIVEVFEKVGQIITTNEVEKGLKKQENSWTGCSGNGGNASSG